MTTETFILQFEGGTGSKQVVDPDGRFGMTASKYLHLHLIITFYEEIILWSMNCSVSSQMDIWCISPNIPDKG